MFRISKKPGERRRGTAHQFPARSSRRLPSTRHDPPAIQPSEFSPYPAQPPTATSLGTTAAAIGDLVFFPTPTPGQANPAEGFLGFLQPVAFTHKRGVYDAPFQLQLTAGDAETIFYTTDGSNPDGGAGILYTTPLEISTTTVLRAVAERAGFVPSKTTTHSYLFPEDVVRQSSDGTAPPGWPTLPVNQQEFYYQMHPDVVQGAGQATIVDALRSLPSLSLVTPLPNLIDRTTGIYVNPENRGRAWERPGSLELLDPAGGKRLPGRLRDPDPRRHQP